MIDQISLENFKCFESQALKVRMLTLLTGLNGMGKSSVLQSLLLLRQSYLDGLLPKIGLELNGSLVRMGTAQDVLFESAQEDAFSIQVAWSNRKAVCFVFQYHRESDILKITSGDHDCTAFDEALFSDSFHYLQAERFGPRIFNPVSDYLVREHGQLGTNGEYAPHFLHLYGKEPVCDERLMHPGAKSKQLDSQVQAWLHEISPGTELHLNMHSEMDLVNLRYSFVTGEQRSRPYRSTAVGFGITYVLPLLLAVLSSKPGCLVLVENPEAHLHPRGQSILGELFARAAAVGIQIILETHSDHILNGVRVAVRDGILEPEFVAFHFFSREEGEGHVHSVVDSPVIDVDGRLDRWPEGFFDEWDRNLERLLEPRGR